MSRDHTRRRRRSAGALATRHAARIAIALAAGVAFATPASALPLPTKPLPVANPCVYSPAGYITVTRTVVYSPGPFGALSYPQITGRCFSPGTTVIVHFTEPATGWADSVSVAATTNETFQTPALTAAPIGVSANEYIVATSQYGTSNTITDVIPGIQ